VNLRRVVIGHSGDSTDIDYLTGLMAKGAYLGMDRFRSQTTPTTDERVAVIAELCRQGFSNQIVLSHDAAVFNDFTPTSAEKTPDQDFTFIPRVVEGKMRASDVTDEMLDTMLIRNPREVLAGPAGGSGTLGSACGRAGDCQ